MKRPAALLLALVLLVSLAACGGRTAQESAQPSSPAAVSASPEVQESAEPVVETFSPEELEPEPTTPPVTLVPWPTTAVVEHLFFHPIIAYPTWAWRDAHLSQSDMNGLDDWMCTADEYWRILNSVYEKGYVLVSMNDVWGEVTDPDTGVARMQRNILMIPEGKKPLVISYDDTNYYPYMLEQGFTSKLVLADDGKVWAECTDPYTHEAFLTRELDAITALDLFIEQHPDFSPFGVKGCLSLTGYQGILGYRTQNDIDIPATGAEREAFDANRQKEIEAVKPIVAKLKETGWYFGSHTWGHIRLSTHSLASIQRDTKRWAEEVGSLVGPTQILFYPHGARPDGDHDQGEDYGEQFKWLQSQGFRIFASVGIESYSQVKKTISAVICDRLHPDGTTLRKSRKRYLQFYKAEDIADRDIRPYRPDYDWEW